MLRTLVTLVVSAAVLIVASFLVPGLTVFGFVGALKTAVVIALLSFLVEKLLGKKASPQGRGLVAFLVGALVIYLSQFIIPDSVEATIVGALIASFVIGIIDAVVPTRIR
jgi:putative membrane protein